jgi:exodeoxyribonuclease V gamma subunit
MQETRWYSRDGSYRLRRVTDARTELEKLLALYQKGLAKPLQFFPRSAWKLINTGKPADALNVWQGNRDRFFGENSDPAYQLALRGLQNPLGKAFTELAQTIYQPMLSHLHDDRVGSLLERSFLAQRPAPP